MARAFVDANVFIYATAPPASTASNCLDILTAAASFPGACVTSAEVLQEVLHVLGRRNEQVRVERALDIAVLSVQVVALESGDVLAAARLPATNGLSARDRVHLATMQRLQVSAIISADAAFDSFPGIRRLAPERLQEWRESIFGPV